ncbi:Lrp/AsnC family transcriptional regulator [Leifsonia sp. ZF2019]|uniref:winged helix-turn-helix domain-containing protein n=1 Tax=Leifsonia sp. ZF2019 TaxID=2781978 RepID=UPI001CBF5CAD|nr:Lrp/AsnC family transcriptional regulator [Leifsonia sp. ZF2019]UAJ78990.1 Lrp/AsnC family transcriptional regulator [Leifsonia sp. ZF2019]
MAIVQNSRQRPEPSGQLEALIAKLTSAPQRRRAVAAIAEIAAGREQRELAERRIRRGIYAMHDAGLSQRDIARVAGLSQPEVSRRLKRREVVPATEVTPREIILQRSTGEISSTEMLKLLKGMTFSSSTPRKRSATDGAAGALGTTKQLAEALHDGLLSDEEYEAVRRAIARRRANAR